MKRCDWKPTDADIVMSMALVRERRTRLMERLRATEAMYPELYREAIEYAVLAMKEDGFMRTAQNCSDHSVDWTEPWQRLVVSSIEVLMEHKGMVT